MTPDDPLRRSFGRSKPPPSRSVRPPDCRVTVPVSHVHPDRIAALRREGMVSGRTVALRIGVLLLVIGGVGGGLFALARREQRQTVARQTHDHQEGIREAETLADCLRSLVDRARSAKDDIVAQSRRAAEAMAVLEAVRPKADRSEPSPSAPVAPSPPATSEEPEEGPPGEPTRAQLERLRRHPPPEPPAPRHRQAAQAIPTAEAPISEEVRLRERVRETMSAAEEAAREVQALQNLESQVRLWVAEVARASTPPGWEEKLNRLRKAKAEAQDRAQRLEATAVEARRAAQEVTDARARVEQARAREAEAHARREREERERLQRTKEKDAAEDLHRLCRSLLQRRDFDEALQRLREGREACQTEEGRAAFDQLLARYERLLRLREFLITTLRRQPLPWGWIQDSSPRDVLSADEAGVHLKGKTVPWSAVTAPQLVHWIQRFAADPNVPSTTRTDQVLAAAALLLETGATNAARAFLAKAEQVLPSLKEQQRQWLPELSEGP